MTVDQAIQDMLFNWSNDWIRITAQLSVTDRNTCYHRYEVAYKWTIPESDEFLDNVTLAYELLVKNAA